MPLTTAQETTLRNAILADPVLSVLPAGSGSINQIIAAYRAAAVPDFILYRPDVTSGEIGNAWSGADIDGMSALNMQRLQLMLASAPSGVFDMSRADRRTGFLNPFGASSANPSRVAMTAVFKRVASRLEKLFAIGTGSDASPATIVITGSLAYDEVRTLMGW